MIEHAGAASQNAPLWVVIVSEAAMAAAMAMLTAIVELRRRRPTR